jgi:hypothetical protein
MAYKTRVPPVGSFTHKIPVRPVRTGNVPGKTLPESLPVITNITSGNSRGKLPVLTSLTGNKNKREIVERIKRAWKRVFGIDIDMKRGAPDRPPVGQHSDKILGWLNAPPKTTRYLADPGLWKPEINLKINAVLAEIEAEKLRPPKKAPEPVVLFDEDETEEIETSKNLFAGSDRPGVTPGDVLRIFGNKCKTTLARRDWLETAPADREAIAESARWSLRGGAWRSVDSSSANNMTCRHCSTRKTLVQPWRRNGRIVAAVFSRPGRYVASEFDRIGGEVVFLCSFCGKKCKTKKREYIR